MVLFFFTLLGVIFGSFANVVILRDDRRASILTGRSECPHCHHILQWYELIPVVSYIVQGGKCRSCHKKISIQYPLVEIGMGCLFLLAGSLTNNVGIAVLLAFSLFFFCCASIIDLRTQLIPIEYVLIGGVLGGVAQFLLKTGWMNILFGVVIGAGALIVVKYVWLLLMREDGMGEGDLWLGGALGALCAYPSIIVTLVAAILTGAIVGVIVLAIKKKSWETAIPFGPFLFLGVLVALLWGNQLISWYTNMSGITF